jgi:CRP-like cAMP-binding protein
MSVVQQSIVSELRSALLFSSLDQGQLSRVVASAHSLSLEAGARLFGQGEPAGRFFWIRSGAVKLSRLSPSGEEKIIEILSSGQTFAEALMFMGKESAYPVTAHTLEPTEIMAFPNETFLLVLSESVDTCFRLMADMSQRLHSLVGEIDQLTLRSASARVADFLLARASNEGTVELGLPKHVIASRLSIKPETLSRIFARLSAQGILTVAGGLITIDDPEKLRTLIHQDE